MVISRFKSSAEVLSRCPKYKKAMICLMEKKLHIGKSQSHSGMTYSAVGHKFNVNESLPLNRDT